MIDAMIASAEERLNKHIAALAILAMARFQSTCLTSTGRRSAGQHIRHLKEKIK